MGLFFGPAWVPLAPKGQTLCIELGPTRRIELGPRAFLRLSWRPPAPPLGPLGAFLRGATGPHLATDGPTLYALGPSRGSNGDLLGPLGALLRGRLGPPWRPLGLSEDLSGASRVSGTDRKGLRGRIPSVCAACSPASQSGLVDVRARVAGAAQTASPLRALGGLLETLRHHSLVTICQKST